MFERRHQSLLPKRAFILRSARFAVAAMLVVCGSWGLGIAGYHYLEGLPWLDSVLNAAMILSGMGPVNELHTAAGKLFASFYALFSGVVFLAAVGVLLAPAVHRFYHRFHLETDEERKNASSVRHHPHR